MRYLGVEAMNYCTITWDFDALAAIHATNRDAAVVVVVLKCLTDMARRRSREDVPEVVLAHRRMSPFGLSACRTRQALESLEQAGIVVLRREPGLAYRVRLCPTFYRGLRTRRKGGWVEA